MSDLNLPTISSEDQERLDKARKKRVAFAAEKKSAKVEIEDSREEFRKYFLKLKKKLNLNKSLEEIMWVHFKSAGFDKKEKFELGTAHFGYKVD